MRRRIGKSFFILLSAILFLFILAFSSCGSSEAVAEYELTVSEEGTVTAITVTGEGELHVVIPEGVTNIERGVFAYSKQLKSITLPSTMTEIPLLAFEGCGKLVSATLAEGVRSIENFAFAGCYSLREINFPDSLENLHQTSFEGCTELIEYDDGVYYVNDWAVDCNEYISTVTLREGTRGIAAGAFFEKKRLDTFVFSKDVVYIGESAFLRCRARTVIIPEGWDTLPSGFCSLFENLRRLTLPESLTTIKGLAFDGFYHGGTVIFSSYSNWRVDNSEQTVLYFEDLSTVEGFQAARVKYGAWDWFVID